MFFPGKNRGSSFRVVGEIQMFRKALIIVLMAPLLIGAVNTGISFPVLLLMISLLFVALAESSARDESLDE
jgi:hypothetical protein